MPPRSKIEQLPEKVREELEQRLIAKGFGSYRELAEWLAANGHEISKSALHEWGQSFEDRVKQLKVATAQAKAIVEASPDDEGAVNDALMRLVQEKLFQALMAFNIDPDKVSTLNLGALARAIAELGRASVVQKRFMAEVQAKGTAVIDEMAKATGMSEDQAAAWRTKFLGIAPS
jgi:hypothetical protein